MSFLLTWLVVATVTSGVFVVWVTLRSKPRIYAASGPQPDIRPGYLVQVGPPKCECGICTGAVRLPLTAQEIANVQASVLAVAGGVMRAVSGTADYMTANGVGRVALIVCDDVLFTQVVEPAIKQHLAATRAGT